MVGTIAVIGVYSTLDHSKTRPLEIQLQNVQIPKDSGFQTVGFGSPLNYSRINQKYFFQIRKLKRKRSGDSKSVSKISKKSVEGLEVVEKSHEDLVAIDKSVQRL